MKRNRQTRIWTALIATLLGSMTVSVSDADSDVKTRDYVVYNVFQALNLGNDAKEPPKDYYINMGEQHGLKAGSILEIRRRISSYDLISEQLYRDLSVPIALVKVIHVEPVASIARLQKMLPVQYNPSVSPRAIIVGDLVRTHGVNPFGNKK